MSKAKYKIRAYTHEQSKFTDFVVYEPSELRACKIRIFRNAPGDHDFKDPAPLKLSFDEIARVEKQVTSFYMVGPRSQWYDYSTAKGAFENAKHYMTVPWESVIPSPPTPPGMAEPVYLHFALGTTIYIAELQDTTCTGVANLTTRHFDPGRKHVELSQVEGIASGTDTFHARRLKISGMSQQLMLPSDCTICRYVVPVKESGQRAYRELSYEEARRLFNAIKFEFNNPQAPKPKERNMTTDNKEALTIMQLEGGATIVAAVYASDNTTAPNPFNDLGVSSYHFKNTQQLKLEAGDLIVCETQDTFKILTVVDPDVMVTDIQCQLSELKHVVAKVKSDEYRQIKEAENRALRKLSLGAVASKLDEYKKQLGGNLFEEAAALLGVDPSKNAATNKEDFEAGVVIDAD